MNNKFIKDLLYQFKKDYGAKIRYIVIVQSDLDVETGKRDFIKQDFLIDVVVLPRRISRKFIQDIGYLAANKNFTYGAFNDYNEIKFLIDIDDFPKGLNISLDGYLVYNDKRYEKTEFDLIEHEVAFMLSAKGVEGGKPYDIIRPKVSSGLQLQHGVSFELN
jgi:hypothetical protein